MTTKAIQEVLVKNEDMVSLITLNHPETHNSLRPGVMNGLIQALNEAQADDNIRCVVITGAGRAFCAGGDVRLFVEKYESGESPIWANAGHEPHYSSNQRTMSKPLIAAVNGFAVGSGLQMALGCDIRIASEKARFGAAWIMRALDAASGGVYFLPRTIGLSNAFYMLYTGEIIDAAQALEWGLVTRVLPHDELLPYTMELAKRIAQHPPIPMQMNRRAVYRGLDSSYENVAEWQHANRLTCYRTEDHYESCKAFLGKRAPVYKGK